MPTELRTYLDIREHIVLKTQERHQKPSSAKLKYGIQGQKWAKFSHYDSQEIIPISQKSTSLIAFSV